MKKIILLLLMIFFSSNVTSLAKESLLIVTDEWPPYVFQKNKIITGFDYELTMAVFKNMGYEVDFQMLPWKRCLHMIENRFADAILDIGQNESRRMKMHFPQERISESSSVLFHLKDRHYKYDNLQDLKGLTIGTIRGYEYNKEFLEADFFVRDQVESEEQNFQKLILERIDLVLVNRNVGLFIAKKLGILDKVAYIHQAVSKGDNFVAFSKKPGHDKLAEEFSENLRAFKKSYRFRRILEKYGQ